MTKIMVVAKYPPSKSDELLKIYMSSDKPSYPEFLKKIEHWVPQITEDMFKTYAVYECPEENLIEGLMALGRRFSFYGSIEGYTFKIEILMNADEVIKYTMKK